MAEIDRARIKITIGNLSLEYEGEQSFIENGLINIAEAVCALVPEEKSAGGDLRLDQMGGAPIESLSTNTIAQVISAKTGAELVLAAIARINVIKRSSIATRSEILEEMKEATTYFKESYSSNLSSYLDSLVRGKKINLISRGNYALAAAERSRFEDVLLGDGA